MALRASSLVPCAVTLFPAKRARDGVLFNDINRETGNRVHSVGLMDALRCGARSGRHAARTRSTLKRNKLKRAS